MRHTAIATVLTLGLAGAMSAPASANLITNGDFSAGGASWTTTSNYKYFSGSAYHEGNVGGAGRLSQIFTDTSGDMLTITFDYSSDGGNGLTIHQFSSAHG